MIAPGTFVRVLFPTRERPNVPGLPHIGYVLIVANREAIVAYTTSQPWPAGTPLPAGARLFNVRKPRVSTSLAPSCFDLTPWRDCH